VTTAIILAGGSGKHWGCGLGVPKHFVPIPRPGRAPEPLLNRMVRKLRKRGAARVIISGPDDPRYALPNAEQHVRTFVPGWSGAWPYLETCHLWSTTRRTVVLLGDVVHTPEAMDAIMTPRDEWTMFGRPWHSDITGNRYGEDFAYGFGPSYHAEYILALHHVNRLYLTRQLVRGGSWEVWRHMCGVPDERLLVLTKMPPVVRHVIIDDLTDDIDTQEDYERLMRVREAAGAR